MKDLARGTDRERGSFFLMEGTQPFQILAGSRQTDMLPNDLSDVDPVADLVDHVFRNQSSTHGSRNSSFPQEIAMGF
jgi:hypothetical protein